MTDHQESHKLDNIYDEPKLEGISETLKSALQSYKVKRTVDENDLLRSFIDEIRSKQNTITQLQTITEHYQGQLKALSDTINAFLEKHEVKFDHVSHSSDSSKLFSLLDELRKAKIDEESHSLITKMMADIETRQIDITQLHNEVLQYKSKMENIADRLTEIQENQDLNVNMTIESQVSSTAERQQEVRGAKKIPNTRWQFIKRIFYVSKELIVVLAFIGFSLTANVLANLFEIEKPLRVSDPVRGGIFIALSFLISFLIVYWTQTVTINFDFSSNSNKGEIDA